MGNFDQAASSLCRRRRQHSENQTRSHGAFKAFRIHIKTFLF
jgi:hypothetical protein